MPTSPILRLLRPVLAGLLAVSATTHALTPPHPSFWAQDIAVDDRGNAVVVFNDHHVYRRGPEDARWERVDGPWTPFEPLRLLGNGTATLILAGNTATRRSSDGGRHWHELPPVAWQAMDARGRLFACPVNAPLLRSDDGGLHAQVIGTAPLPNDACRRLMVARDGAIYVVSENARIVRSEDDGRHWAPATLAGDAVLSGDGTLYLNRSQFDEKTFASQEFAMRSADGGRTWQRTAFGAADPQQSAQVIAVDGSRLLAQFGGTEPARRFCIVEHERATRCLGDAMTDFTLDEQHVLLRGDAVWWTDMYEVRRFLLEPHAARRDPQVDGAGLPDPLSGRPREH